VRARIAAIGAREIAPEELKAQLTVLARRRLACRLATDLNSNAAGLTEMAQQAKSQSVTVAAAAEEASVMVASAGSAGENLARTIAEVEANAVGSSRLPSAAVNEVTQTSTTIDELALVAKEISEVTDLITRIAGQTNLLALNATIEAALPPSAYKHATPSRAFRPRAGEAGRGFTVVHRR
jgi:methyl-accepting chemotaxis protein